MWDQAYADQLEAQRMCDMPSVPKGEIHPLQEEADKLGVSVERLIEFKNYAATLHRKFPRMKADRVKRKVAEYFKIKLT